MLVFSLSCSEKTLPSLPRSNLMDLFETRQHLILKTEERKLSDRCFWLCSFILDEEKTFKKCIQGIIRQVEVKGAVWIPHFSFLLLICMPKMPPNIYFTQEKKLLLKNYFWHLTLQWPQPLSKKSNQFIFWFLWWYHINQPLIPEISHIGESQTVTQTQHWKNKNCGVFDMPQLVAIMASTEAHYRRIELFKF